MWKRLATIFALCLLYEMAHGTTCNIVDAPAKFEIATSVQQHSWRPENSGIKPHGFVGLGAAVPLIHGFDVSKYQDSANFEKAHDCGALFAYVRMSGGANPNHELMYRVHWANARASNLIPGPYHSLSPFLPSDLDPRRADIPFSSSEETDLRKNAIEYSIKQAKLFLSRLHEVLSLDPRPDPLTKSASPGYLPIALDLSGDPLSRGTLEDKRNYGAIYGVMACTWLDEVGKSGYPRDAILIFTSSRIYSEYHLEGSPCDLSKNFVWITHRPLDGGSFDEGSDSKKLTEVAKLCRPSGTANRCIFEQYTSYGGFAAFSYGAPLNIDRFHGTIDDLKVRIRHEDIRQ